MGKVRSKKSNNKDVYQAALERIEYIYNNFDTVVVSFSGGKDSTAVLNVAYQVAEKLGKLPLNVIFFDEEVITPPTHDYCRRVASRANINFKWFCLEMKQRNACSYNEPYWWSWDRYKQSVWTRPMPAGAIRQVAGYDARNGDTSTGVADASDAYLDNIQLGKVCILTGIRTDESLRRYRIVSQMQNDNYINSRPRGTNKNIYSAHPLYDWRSTDVWLAVKKNNWDYNATYDVFNLTNELGGKYLHQRVCPPFGEEPLRGFSIYQKSFPEMWALMCNRVAGVGAAARYANSELFGVAVNTKPANTTWKDYLFIVLQSYNPTEYSQLVEHLNGTINMHYNKSILSIEEEDADPLSGVCWKTLCTMAMRGDFKARIAGTLINRSQASERGKGKTFEELVELYGTERFKQKCKLKYKKTVNKNKR